jgi:hypothetical protein
MCEVYENWFKQEKGPKSSSKHLHCGELSDMRLSVGPNNSSVNLYIPFSGRNLDLNTVIGNIDGELTAKNKPPWARLF